MARHDRSEAQAPTESRVSIADAALRPLAPGPTLRIAHGDLAVEIAPQAGGRIAQIVFAGVEWLQGHDAGHDAAIGWGCYPMLPWAGRVRHGRFDFEGRRQTLPCNLGAHAIHGVGFVLPWTVDAQSAQRIDLSLQLPDDARWPFGGSARQRIEVGERRLRLDLSVTAGARAMPATIGWHPWLLKPDAMTFAPQAVYPRDADGIATLPLAVPSPRPWDDCFINRRPVGLQRVGQMLRLASDCSHWVVYDAPAHATCIEPQSGPPDAFNLAPFALAPGATLDAWFLWEWESVRRTD